MAFSTINIPFSKLGIGIPAYGRALANIDEGTNPNHPGLFSPITNLTVIPKGDLDPGNCDNIITDPYTPNSCNGMFSYNYIVSNMLNKGFTSYNPTNNDNNVINGTIAYAKQWIVPSFDYKLTLIIVGANEQIKIDNNSGSEFDTKNWISGTQVYPSANNPKPTMIAGQTGLSVKFYNWAQPSVPGVCIDSITQQPFTFDFTKDVTIKITSGNPATNVTCELVN